MKIESNSGHSQAVSAQPVVLSLKESATLAFKKSGLYLGLAVVSVFFR